MFKPRPIRALIYGAIRKCNVSDADWPFVGLAAALSFLIPYFFNWSIYYIPLSPFTCLAGIAASVGFFSWATTGRRPRWYKHKIRSLLKKPFRGRALGCDFTKTRNTVPWLLDR